MIYVLRQYQSTVSRSLLSLLLGVWLSLALVPCVMAMNAADAQMGYQTSDMANDLGNCHTCHSSETCASKSNLLLSGNIEPVVPVESSFILVSARVLPGLPVPEPPQLVTAYQRPETNLVKQHPSLKFRVLRI